MGAWMAEGGALLGFLGCGSGEGDGYGRFCACGRGGDGVCAAKRLILCPSIESATYLVSSSETEIMVWLQNTRTRSHGDGV